MIEVVAFLLTIAETYVFFVVIVPLGPIPHGLTEYTAIGLLKLGATFALGLAWLAVITLLTRYYVRSELRAPTPTSSS
jgi:hypothetical protein